jgi:hypothetical protein
VSGLEVLKQSIEEHSILWILASGLIGGFIGSFSKFLFETLLATRLKARNEADAALDNFKYPLLRAADALDRRLENWIRHGAGKNWFEDADDEYYKLSTLYLLGTYLGWCLILERLAISRHMLSHRKARKFNKSFFGVFKSITGQSYFASFPRPSNQLALAGVPRLQLTEIGEQMVASSPETWRKNEPDIIGYVEFKRRYKETPAFKESFAVVEQLFTGTLPRSTDAQFNRILVIATVLRTFVADLDPRHRQVTPRGIYYLEKMHSAVAQSVWNDLKSRNFCHIVRNKQHLAWTRQHRWRNRKKTWLHYWRQKRLLIKQWWT